jgi:hypothetical protein
MGDLAESLGLYITLVRVFGQWFRWNDTAVKAVDESATLQGNFPQTEDFTQIASILLYVANN